MSEEKLKIIRNSADEYKKLPKDKQMFILGYMQGVLCNHNEKNQLQEAQRGGGKVRKNKKALDKIIELTCKKIQNENMIPEVYNKTLKALAKLVKARAGLN